MKKIMFTALAAVLAAFLVTACSSDSGGGETLSVPPVDTLAPSGADMPTTEDEAVELYNEAFESLKINSPDLESSSSGMQSARATTNTPVNMLVNFGSGKAVYTGTMSVTTPDNPESMEGTVSSSYNLTAVYTDAQVYLNGGSTGTYYTLNGTSRDKSSGTTTFVVDQANKSITINFSGSINSACSMSFKRSSDGKGGKFVASYSVSYSGTMDFMDMFAGFNSESILADLQKSTINIKVYDDSNTLVMDVTKPLDLIDVSLPNKTMDTKVEKY
jgi:hypothetical protein